MEDLVFDLDNLAVQAASKNSNSSTHNEKGPSVHMHEIVMQSYDFKRHGTNRTSDSASSNWKRAVRKAEHIEDPWHEYDLESYQVEKAICHCYNPLNNIWTQSECLVKMEWPKAPFACGAMRDCYRL